MHPPDSNGAKDNAAITSIWPSHDQRKLGSWETRGTILWVVGSLGRSPPRVVGNLGMHSCCGSWESPGQFSGDPGKPKAIILGVVGKPRHLPVDRRELRVASPVDHRKPGMLLLWAMGSLGRCSWIVEMRRAPSPVSGGKAKALPTMDRGKPRVFRLALWEHPKL